MRSQSTVLVFWECAVVLTARTTNLVLVVAGTKTRSTCLRARAYVCVRLAVRVTLEHVSVCGCRVLPFR